jgi:hypothetical protein
LDKQKNATKKKLTVAEKYIKQLTDQQKEYDGLIDKMSILDEAYQDNIISNEIYTKELDKLEKSMGLVEDQIESTAKRTYELSDSFKTALEQVDRELQAKHQVWTGLFEEFGRGVFDSWVRFWEDALDGSINSFRSFTDAIIDQFKAMVARMLAIWSASKVLNFLGINIPGIPGGGGLLGAIGTGASIKNIGGKVASVLGLGGAAGSATAYALPATAPIIGTALAPAYSALGAGGLPASVALGGPGAAGAGGAGLLSGGLPALGYAGLGLGLIALGSRIGRGNRRSELDVWQRLNRAGVPFSPIGGGISGRFNAFAGGDTGFLSGISKSDAEMLLRGPEALFDAEGMNVISQSVREFGDAIAATGEQYKALVTAIEDGGDTIIGTHENLKTRVTAAMGRMSDETIRHFRNIKLDSTDVANVIQDGFISSTELAGLGFGRLQGMSYELFRAIVENAQSAASAIGELSAAAGGAAFTPGPRSPLRTTPYIPTAQSSTFDIGELAAQHGGTFNVMGKPGIDGNRLRVSSGERVTVETPGQQGQQVALLRDILKQITRQNSDLSRMMARTA